ncbi:LytTR family DNA-binding domain-containing protein [uncultured Croceitalea sp.]|uniref:LytR/AlgR family response regulator transcription factor n=1 Tax=uncultured Croceitalea sp. TaxID=1798908 RepID=UPI00330692DC
MGLFKNKDAYILLLKLFLLAQVCFAYRAYLCSWSCVDIYEYMQMLFGCTLLIGLIYLPFSLYAKNVYYQDIIGAEKTSEQSQLFPLKGANKEPLLIALDSIIYFKADDNYVDIAVFSERESLKTIAFRVTISSIEKQLLSQARFARVHRSFIINLNYLSSSDEKGSLKLVAGSDFFEIPVSKKYQKVILELPHWFCSPQIH